MMYFMCHCVSLSSFDIFMTFNDCRCSMIWSNYVNSVQRSKIQKKISYKTVFTQLYRGLNSQLQTHNTNTLNTTGTQHRLVKRQSNDKTLVKQSTIKRRAQKKVSWLFCLKSRIMFTVDVIRSVMHLGECLS